MADIVHSTTRVRKEQALELLTRGMPPVDVAAALGISSRTVRRYLEDGKILAELRRVQTERVEALARAAQMAAPAALVTLHSISTNPDASDHARVSAARALLDQALKLFDSTDVTRRLEQLEETADVIDKSQPRY